MKATFTKIKNNDDYYLFGARAENNLLVGTVMAVVCHDMAKECRPFMVMENIIIDGGWHRKGIGSMMISTVESIARDRDCIFV